MSEFIRVHFMDASLGHLYLAYLILNIVWTIVLKFIYDLNDRICERFKVSNEISPNVGYYPLCFCWMGPLGSIVMIFFSIPAIVGAILMVIEVIDRILTGIVNLCAPKPLETEEKEILKENTK